MVPVSLKIAPATIENLHVNRRTRNRWDTSSTGTQEIISRQARELSLFRLLNLKECAFYKADIACIFNTIINILDL